MANGIEINEIESELNPRKLIIQYMILCVGGDVGYLGRKGIRMFNWPFWINNYFF